MLTFQSHGVKQPARALEFRADSQLAPLVGRMRLAMHVFQRADALWQSRRQAFADWAGPMIEDEKRNNATGTPFAEWQARFAGWNNAWNRAVHVDLSPPPEAPEPPEPPEPPKPPSPFYLFSGCTPVPEPASQTRLEKRLHHSLTTLLQGLTPAETAAMRYEHGRNRRYAKKQASLFSDAANDDDEEEVNEQRKKEAARGACDRYEYDAAVQNIRRAQLEAEYEDSIIVSFNGTTKHEYLTTPIVSWLQIEDLYLLTIRPRHPWASFLNWFFTNYDDDDEYELVAKGVFSPPNYIFVRPSRDYSFQLLGMPRLLMASSSSSNPLLLLPPPPPPPPFVRVQQRGQEDVDYFIYGGAPIPGLPDFVYIEGYDNAQMTVLKMHVERLETKKLTQTKKRPASSSARAASSSDGAAAAPLLLPTHNNNNNNKHHPHPPHSHAHHKQHRPDEEDDRRATLSSSAAPKKSSSKSSGSSAAPAQITSQALMQQMLRELRELPTPPAPKPKGLGKSPHIQRK